MTPSQRIVQGKRSSVDPTKSKKKASSENDWILQELAEGEPIPRTGDTIDDAVGRKLHLTQDSRPDWKTERGHRFKVTRHYFHEPAIIIDKPYTVEEMQEKERFFAKTPTTYVAISPNESLSSEDLRRRIREALLQTSARIKKPKLPAKTVKNPPIQPSKPSKPLQAKKKAKR